MSAPTFLSFESRRIDEMRSLILRQGGDPTVVASMREVPLEANDTALAFAEQLLADKFDGVIFLTGVGAEALAEAFDGHYELPQLVAALNCTSVAVRGPKPAAVMKRWGVNVAIRAPEPNTSRELLAAMQAHGNWTGCRVAVQEYGQPSAELYEGLQRLGVEVFAVPVYRWALPEDTAPLETALRTSLEAGFDIYGFTSAQQVENVLTVAENLGIKQELHSAIGRGIIASIGPTCSLALREHGFEPTVEASPSKMGPFVRSAVEAASRR